MSGSASPPPRVTHGVTLPGFVSRTGPLPPEPGCYVVLASGPSHARFHIGAGGRVVAEGRRRTSMVGLANKRWRRRPFFCITFHAVLAVVAACRCDTSATWLSWPSKSCVTAR